MADPDRPRTDPLRPDLGEALATWASRVRANRDQVNRVREVADGDFYAPVAPSFRFDPARADEGVLQTLEALVLPGEDVLDIGAGGGRYALALARVARTVIALDASAAMLETLRAGIAETGLGNVEVIDARWPTTDPRARADVALMANVAYDIEEIGPFLDAMERAAGRLCVAVLLELPPPFAIDALWPLVHGEPRATLPALPEFLVLQLARGRLCEVRLLERPTRGAADPAAFLTRARRMLWVREGGAKDRRLLEIIPSGNATPGLTPRVGVVSWRPK